MKNQNALIVMMLLQDGSIDNLRISKKVDSTTPSRRVADMREVFGKQNLKRRVGKGGYAEFYIDGEIRARFERLWLTVANTDEYDKVVLAFWKKVRTTIW